MGFTGSRGTSSSASATTMCQLAPYTLAKVRLSSSMSWPGTAIQVGLCSGQQWQRNNGHTMIIGKQLRDKSSQHNNRSTAIQVGLRSNGSAKSRQAWVTRPAFDTTAKTIKA
eukprot:1161766-Pelagomonas_calceolata.AAC.2